MAFTVRYSGKESPNSKFQMFNEIPEIWQPTYDKWVETPSLATALVLEATDSVLRPVHGFSAQVSTSAPFRLFFGQKNEAWILEAVNSELQLYVRFSNI